MEIATVKILRSQRDRWKQEAELLEREVADDPANARALFWGSRGLASEWALLFPELFDEEDCRLVIRQGKYGWHFVEWVAAIWLYHRTGYRSLLGKYEFRTIRGKARSPRRRSRVVC